MARSVRIIGFGNMGGALVRGLMASPLASSLEVRVFDVHQERLRDIGRTKVKALKTAAENGVSEDALILCVKPHDLDRVASELKGQISASTVVISILAGTRIADIAHALNFSGAIVRAMPNVGATVLCAATAMCHNDSCREDQRELAHAIFQAVGEAYWTKEALMDTVTGLSGSGPAYIYMVIEALTDGGVKMGLPRDLASKLATQTVLGAAMLVKETGTHPAILKDQVTTPGGTTITALHELEAHGLRSMFVSAVVTATERSRYLGQKDKDEGQK